MSKAITTVEIRNLIYHIRGKSVMLDTDLAELYDVDTRTLNQAVKRNIDRFPADFMFQLTQTEYEGLRSQIVISKHRGGRRYFPFAFTEQGVSMLSTVLKSNIAIKTNIQIMRTFVAMRRIGLTYMELKRKIDGMEKKYDQQFQVVFKAIRQLLNPPPDPSKNRRIGFSKD